MKLVIIGNGVAGITTARLVSAKDPKAEITIYSDEKYPYYARPRLIEYLAGRMPLDDLTLYDEPWYEQRGIRAMLQHRITAIEPADHCVVDEQGTRIAYDHLVIATGAHPWRPPIPGIEMAGIHTLRTIDDVLTIEREASAARHAVVLGGGLLGLDTAMALRAKDLDVTVVELLPWLLPRQLDRQGGEFLQREFEEQGVRVITGTACKTAVGEDRVRELILADGRNLPADVVLVSAGVRSNTSLALDAGLTCNRGIVVDEGMKTSAPDVYAVGDAAEYGERVWAIIPAAIAQARVAAAQIVDDTDTLYEDIVPSTTLQVIGIDLTSMGEVNPEGGEYREIRWADADACTYKKLVVRDNRIVGAILLGDTSDVRSVSRLIERGTDISNHCDVLLDPDFDLGRLGRRA